MDRSGNEKLVASGIEAHLAGDAVAPLYLHAAVASGHKIGRVIDFQSGLDGAAEAYAVMEERRAIKSVLRLMRSNHTPDALEPHN